MKLQPSPVKAAALELGIPVLQPEKASLPEFVEELGALGADAAVVVAYGQILKPAVLDIPPLGCINVHGSLLPELRGAAPIQWSIIRGYPETGVTTMFMDAGMDTGDVILKESIPIFPQETAGELTERLAPVGAALLVRTLAMLESGTAPREAQDASRATYAPMLRREDGRVRWSESAAQVCNRIHGCNPAPGAYAARDGSTVKLWRAEAVPEAPPAAPGTVLETDPLTLRVGEGAVRLLEVQPESRGRMTGTEFARGFRIPAGEVWREG
jgi:methionyl-tRNA formyltransferase